MRFHITTTITLPPDLDPEVRADLLERDRAWRAEHGVEQEVGGRRDFVVVDKPDAAELDAFLKHRPARWYAHYDVSLLQPAEPLPE